jgi:ABC-type phosphate/phosphonate transport system substrate-binding protein
LNKSGSHRASLRAVAAGKADVCAIDAVCLAMARRHDRDAMARLRVLGPTPKAPSLPFVTAASRPPAEVVAIREALAEAIADPALAEVCAQLFLSGIAVLEDAAYDRITAIEQKAVSLGYGVVA